MPISIPLIVPLGQVGLPVVFAIRACVAAPAMRMVPPEMVSPPPIKALVVVFVVATPRIATPLFRLIGLLIT